MIPESGNLGRCLQLLQYTHAWSYPVELFIGRGTMGAVGALAPILWQLWGQCPHTKFNDITIVHNNVVGNDKTWSTLVVN